MMMIRLVFYSYALATNPASSWIEACLKRQ